MPDTQTPHPENRRWRLWLKYTPTAPWSDLGPPTAWKPLEEIREGVKRRNAEAGYEKMALIEPPTAQVFPWNQL